MKKIFSIVIAMMIIFIARVDAANETAELVIFHTNDMHARVSHIDDNGQSIGLAEISAAVKNSKLKNPDTLWLDAGDTLHGMPRINISRGENMIALLNNSSLDAMSPGNHDYNYGATRLIELSKKFNFAILSANTVKQGTKKNVFKPYKIFKLPNNIKVGVFGLTTPETAYKSNPKNTEGIEFLNPIDQAKLMIKKLRPKCDVVIAVMHMGLDQSSEFTSDLIAKNVEGLGLDLIIDGHSHTALTEGLNIGDTLIAQTGWHGHKLGCVKLEIKDHKIISKSAELLDVEKVKKIAPKSDAVIEKTLAEIEERNEKLFSEVVAKSDRALTSDRLIVRRQESELGNLSADAFKWRTKADIAIVNGGGLRSDLPAGDITRGDIMSIFPFGNTIQVVEISGKTIREMLNHSVYGYPASFGGFLDVSGLTFTFDPLKPNDQRVEKIFVNGQPLDENKIYTMAANDFILAGGDDYDMLKNLKEVGEFETCEEILADYLNKVGMNGIEIGRIKTLNAVEMPDEVADGEEMKQAA